MAYFLNSSFSTFLITDFIDKYNINVNKYINFNGTKYDSFNDFFTRKLVNLPEINLNSNDFRSPCTSRITSYSNIDANKFITKIKGLDFSINKLLDTTENFNINTILICRLAIQDYHHFHMPLTGKLTNIKKVGSDYLITEKSQLSVLTENYREVYEFINNDFKFWIVPIGSLLVGSIKNTLEIDKTYYSGERIGNFELGGSTVVILSEKTINIDDDILYYSDLNIETYVKVGDIIGSMVTKNIVEFPTKYYIINKKPESYSSNIIFKMVGILLLLYLIMILVWNNKNNKFFTIKNNIENI
jgi:phosphatidylserine decarboxylase